MHAHTCRAARVSGAQGPGGVCWAALRVSHQAAAQGACALCRPPPAPRARRAALPRATPRSVRRVLCRVGCYIVLRGSGSGGMCAGLHAGSAQAGCAKGSCEVGCVGRRGAVCAKATQAWGRRVQRGAPQLRVCVCVYTGQAEILRVPMYTVRARAKDTGVRTQLRPTSQHSAHVYTCVCTHTSA